LNLNNRFDTVCLYSKAKTTGTSHNSDLMDIVEFDKRQFKFEQWLLVSQQLDNETSENVVRANGRSTNGESHKQFECVK